MRDRAGRPASWKAGAWGAQVHRMVLHRRVGHTHGRMQLGRLTETKAARLLLCLQ